jgi:uncharacterized protein (TIGR02996 family)
MSDRTAFLRAIRAAPDDDALRLAFADWLEERGDPLGEFIRLQCALEPVRDRYHDERVEELRRREEQLLKEHRAEWLGPLDDLTGDYPHVPGHGTFHFRRGFVEAIHLPVPAFLDRAEELRAWCPLLREATFFRVRGAGRELARSAHLEAFRRIELADWLTEDDAGALAGSDYLDELAVLQVWLGGRDEEAVCQTLAVPPALGLLGLRELELVQLLGGLDLGNRAYELADRANALAVGANAMRGNQIARVLRPFERLFPLWEDLGHSLYAGRLSGDRHGLVAVPYHETEPIILTMFGADGRRLAVQRRGPLSRLLARKPDRTYETYNREELLEYLRREFGFEPALIHVREFTTDEGLAVHLWPYFAECLANPDEIGPPSTEEEWRELGEQAWRWLAKGNFVIDWGNDYWAGPDGEIHSS